MAKKERSKNFHIASALIGLTALLLAGSAHAQSAPVWRPIMTGGGAGADAAIKAQADGNGDIVTGGVFSATARFGERELTAAGSSDMYLAKYSRQGAIKWMLQLGGTTEDVLSDFALDNSGNIYITGWTSGPAQFGSTEGEPRRLEFNGQNIFIAKYSPKGALLWIETGTAPQGMNRGHGIAVNPYTGTSFITGMAQTTTAFSSSSGAPGVVPGPWTWHMFLVKYDSEGKFLWGVSNTASPNAVPYKVAIDHEDASYSTGWLESSTTFTSTDGKTATVAGFSRPVQMPPYLGDAFLVKYDADGRFQWVNHIGGYKANATDVAVSPRGFVSFTGQIGNFSDGDLHHASTVVTSQDGATVNLGGGAFTSPFNRDAFIATYDLGGKLLFSERIGGQREEVGGSIFYDSAGDLYLAGGFADLLSVGGFMLRGSGPVNLFLIKYSSNTDSPLPSGPQLVWGKAADNVMMIDPPAGYPKLGLTPEGNLLLAGAFKGQTDFDGTKAESQGETDAFVVEVLSNEPARTENPETGPDMEPNKEESVFDSISRWFSKTF